MIAENLDYKREHGELEDWKGGFDKPFLQGFKGQPMPPPAMPPAGPMYGPPAPAYGQSIPSGPVYGPSYSSDYNSIPQDFKLEKGLLKGIKAAQAQVMKGFGRLVGLKDLNELLHPGGKKWKKRPQLTQYYPPSYSYPQEYAPAPAYAPPPAAYDPAPAYAPPAPRYPAYFPPPTSAPAPPPPPPPTSAPAPPPPPPPTSAPAPPPPPYVPAQPPAMYNPPVYPQPMYLRAPQSPRAIGDQNNVVNVVSPAPSMDSSNPEPPTPSIIQSNDFMPIYPSAVDPLPFMPSPSLEAPDSSSSGNVMFGVPPTPSSRESRYEDSTPSNPSPDVTTIQAVTQTVPEAAVPVIVLGEEDQSAVATTNLPPSANNSSTDLPYGARIRKPATVSVTK